MKFFVTFRFLIGYFIAFVVSTRNSNVCDDGFTCEVTKGVCYHHNALKTKLIELKHQLYIFLVYVPWEKFLNDAKELTDERGQHIASKFLAVNGRMKQSLYARDFSAYTKYATKALSLAKKWQTHVENTRILEASKKLINLYEIVLDKRNCAQICMNRVQIILQQTYDIVTTC